MVIGYAIIEMWICESSSLKGKRGVLKSILKRTQNEFNVSIAEIAENDHWKRAKIGFCIVGNDSRYVNSKIELVLNFIQDMQTAEIINTKVEIVHVSDLMDHCDFEERKYEC